MKVNDSQFVIYDGRWHNNPERASILSCCASTLEQALQDAQSYGDWVIVHRKITSLDDQYIETGEEQLVIDIHIYTAIGDMPYVDILKMLYDKLLPSKEKDDDLKSG